MQINDFDPAQVLELQLLDLMGEQSRASNKLYRNAEYLPRTGKPHAGKAQGEITEYAKGGNGMQKRRCLTKAGKETDVLNTLDYKAVNEREFLAGHV